MLGHDHSDHVPLRSADPMSSGNPYASQSPRGFDQPEKKSRKKMWIIIGVIVALIVIVGAVVGGVLGSRASNDSSSGSGSSADQANGGSGNDNAAAPSGVTSVNSEALTATAADRYLAIATDSHWMLPVYPSAVSQVRLHVLPMLMIRPTLPDTLHLPLLDPVTRGPQTPRLLAPARPEPTLDSLLNTSGTPSPVD
jgi:hypothetical protein